MISAMAVELADRALGGLRGRRVVMVGAGRVAETTVRGLVRRGAGPVGVIDRCGPARLADALPSADIVIASTDADPVILGRGEVETAMARRAGRRMLVLDVSVPRDVDERVARVPGVTLLDAGALARAGVAEAAAAAAVADLRARADDVRRAELARARGRWASLGPGDRRRVESVTRAIVDALLDGPAARLRAAGAAGDLDRVAALREVLGLGAPGGRQGRPA